MTANLPSLLASDLEGVLIPEIWVCVAEKTGIETLKLTTREIANYDELMQIRLRTMREHGLTIHDVHEVIATIDPVSYTHLRAHETVLDLVCRLLLEKKKK